MKNITDGNQQHITQAATVIKEMCASAMNNFIVKCFTLFRRICKYIYRGWWQWQWSPYYFYHVMYNVRQQTSMHILFVHIRTASAKAEK
jgi:hypothetical protein